MDRRVPENAARVRAVYGREASLGVYDALTWLTFLGRSSALRARMVELAGVGPGDRVLDIGCGTGLNLEHIVARVGGAGEVVGIDLTEKMLDRAHRRVEARGWKNVTLMEGDATALPFPDGHFDAACSTLALSVVPEWRRALREALRVVAPRGRISVLDASALRGRWRWLAPAVHAAYRRFAVWQPEVELDRGLADLGLDVAVERPLAGLFYIATARRRDATRG